MRSASAKKFDADELLEQRIALTRMRYLGARTPLARKALWAELKALIASRSDEQIARMEHARGLR